MLFFLLIILGSCQTGSNIPPTMQPAEPQNTLTISIATKTSSLATKTISPTKTQDSANPFTQIARASDFGGKITDLWYDPESQQVFLSSLKGFYHISDDSWAPLFSQSVIEILGKDDAGRIWTLTSGGNSITSWNGISASTYGEKMGWTAPHSKNYLGFGFGDQIVTDQTNRVYLTTGFDDLRRFESDISAWRSLSPRELTFKALERPDSQEYFLTDVIKSSSDHIWVSSCIGDGEKLLGNGLRRLDGNTWKEILELQDQCILDLESDSAGRVWAAGVDALFAYNPNTDSWTKYSIPEDYHGRQSILDIQLDSKERPWLIAMRGGSAKKYGSLAIYFFPYSDWVKVYETESWQPVSIYPDMKGEIVYCLNGGVYETISAKPQLIGRLSPGKCIVQTDANGQIWIAMLDGIDTGLWLYNPDNQ